MKGDETGKETTWTNARKTPKVSKWVSHWKHLSVMLTDLFFQLHRQRWESGEVIRQPWAAGKALRCLEEETWCSRETTGDAESGAGWRVTRVYRGICGGSPDAGKEAKTQGGWFRFCCHWKSVRELADIQLTPWTIPAIKDKTTNIFMERRDTGSFIMTIYSLFCLAWWHYIHKTQVEKASSNFENIAPLTQKLTDPFFSCSLADVICCSWSFKKKDVTELYQMLCCDINQSNQMWWLQY